LHSVILVEEWRAIQAFCPEMAQEWETKSPKREKFGPQVGDAWLRHHSTRPDRFCLFVAGFEAIYSEVNH
jgi:hypothetical protein